MLKVLIVDDDLDYLDELKCEVFEDISDQIDLREANDGKTAINLIKRFRPDLLVVDMIFPMEGDGYPVMTLVFKSLTRFKKSSRNAMSSPYLVAREILPSNC